MKVGNRVAVIGGGSVAMDAARVSRRLGAKEVHLICLESTDLTCKDRMPAQDLEVEQAGKEGVIIHPCLGIRKVLTEKRKVVGLETVRCTSVINEKGKFAPEFGEGATPTIMADMVIVAIGQRPDDKDFFEVERTPSKTIKIDEMTFETNIKGVFAGGDVATGAGTVSEAIASGKKGAMAIHRFLEKEAAGQDVFQREVVSFEELNPDYFYPAPKHVPGHLDLAQAVRSFDEVCLGYPEDQALKRPRGVSDAPRLRLTSRKSARAVINCAERCPASAITIEPLQTAFHRRRRPRASSIRMRSCGSVRRRKSIRNRSSVTAPTRPQVRLSLPFSRVQRHRRPSPG